MPAVRTTTITAGLLTVLLFSPVQAGTADAMLTVRGDWEEVDGGRTLKQEFRFVNDLVAYGLNYLVEIPEGTPPGKCVPRREQAGGKLIALGMSSPARPNWYYQSFIGIQIDGTSLHDLPGEFREVRRFGPDTLLEGTWATSKGPVYLRLLLRSRDDKLLVQVALAPETDAKRLEVSLSAYPQGFDQPRNRRLATAARDVEAPASVVLDKDNERWALLYDELLQTANTAAGPCGVVYVPDELDAAVVGLGPYNVRTTFRSKPGGRKVTLGVWDFTPQREAAQVRRYLTESGSTIADDLAVLAETDWLAGPVPATRLTPSRVEELARLTEIRRRPTPFDEMTGTVVTPHVAWAKPLAGGPVRLLVVGPRWEQRETVELAQRLDLEYQTVSVSAPDSLLNPGSLYLYGSYEIYGYPRRNETDVIFEMADKLRAENDCVILTGFQPKLMPDQVRDELVEKVRGGTGLVLLGAAKGFLAEMKDQLEPADWSADVVPATSLPALDRMVAEGQPIATAYRCGKGRVLVLHYAGGRLCLTPGLGHEDMDVLGYYDYFHSLVASAVLWAADREPAVRIGFTDQPGEVLVHAEQAVPGAVLEVMDHDPARGFREQAVQKLDLPQGESRHVVPLPGPATGPRLVSVWVKQDGTTLGWATGHADGGADAPYIESLALNEAAVPPGGTLSGTVELSAAGPDAVVELEVSDSLGRLLVEVRLTPTGTTAAFQIELPQTVALLHEVRARLFQADRLLDQQVATFAVPDRTVDDFHLLAWSDGGNHAVRHFINRELAAGGVDWIDNTGMTGGDAVRAAASCRNAARWGLRSIPYITRISSQQANAGPRRPCLTDPKHLEGWTAGLADRAGGAAAFGPPAYTLGDENYLVHGRVDVCTSPTCLAAFRAELQQRYGSLDALNAAWGTTFGEWEEVVPATFAEIKDQPEHWPRWADHRLYMDRVLTGAHAIGREAIRRADPGARVGFDGVFDLNSWHGYDFYQLCRACDLVQVYACRPPQIEYLRSWKQPDAIVGAWYNHTGNYDEVSAKRLGWDLLFHGFNSSWYWTSYNTGPALLFPDLRAAPQFTWMQESHAEIMGGIGKLLLGARREQDGIAIHYSQASVHAGTLTGRTHSRAQLGFARLVEDLGLQFDMLSYEQIEQGELGKYKALLMPASTAVSPAEVEAIGEFVEAGGLVIADTLPGILDDHCRLAEPGLLDGLFGVSRNGLPEAADKDPIRVATEEVEVELPLPAFAKDIEPAGAKPWAMAGTAPAVLVRQSGKGWTVVLNVAIEQYEGLHAGGNTQVVRQVAARLLDLAEIRPQVRITADGMDVDACETVRFTDDHNDRIHYVSIVRDNRAAGVKPQEVTVHFPESAWLYDVRAGRPLGRAQTIETELLPGDPKVFALLPYEVTAVSVRPRESKGRVGATLAFDITIQTSADKPAGLHCVRVELLGPDGDVLKHYSRNLLTREASVPFSFDAALNDPVGTWRLRATHVATGCTVTVPFELEGR
ncbi:MAG: beta-galactosidase trimerization domain-containing protein [Thermoguttaceae bacterium]|nr:beta-galactosidase trimerization domain-containing protein [Thermoguttaceae bacterium]